MAGDEWTVERVQALVDDLVQESKTLDYKEALPGGGKSERADFVADICAMANTDGGAIIYGIEEQRDDGGKPTGLPKSIKWLHTLDDEIVRGLESWAQTLIEPRIPRCNFIPLGSGAEQLLIVEVERSWTGPHMITTGSSRFYRRLDRSNEPMDVHQIRHAFAASETAPQRVRAFVHARMNHIEQRGGPGQAEVRWDLAHGLLHLVPESISTPGEKRIDVRQLKNRYTNDLPVVGYPGRFGRLNLDGLVSWWPGSYAQLFRSGAIESVGFVGVDTQGGSPLYAWAEGMIMATEKYLALMRSFEVEPPVYAVLTLYQVKDVWISTKRTQMFSQTRTSFDRNIVSLPDVMIETLDGPADVALRPLFDLLWQAAGEDSCWCYNADGRWESGKW
jgi:hypothetical protein